MSIIDTLFLTLTSFEFSFFIWTIVPDLAVDADKDVVVFVPHQQLPMSETKSLLCIIILYNFNINYFTVLFGISRNRKVGFKSN